MDLHTVLGDDLGWVGDTSVGSGQDRHTCKLERGVHMALGSLLCFAASHLMPDTSNEQKAINNLWLRSATSGLRAKPSDRIMR